jgi:hypothetical protein
MVNCEMYTRIKEMKKRERKKQTISTTTIIVSGIIGL